MGTGTVTPRPGAYDADYIVVGSGAGGGTVAARLAESGFRVLLIEAGGDPRKTVGSTPQTPGINSLPDDYDVPAFHPLSTENDGIRWDFFVRHYEDRSRQEQDPKYRTVDSEGKPVDGVLYPRAGTLGGCTAHNAMILVYPHNADWNQLADLTGDASWRAEHMRSYFERVERCEHRPDERKDSRPGHNPSRHGWSGWLQTESATPLAVFKDKDFRKMLIDTAKAALRSPEVAITDEDRRARLDSQLDPNDWRVVSEDAIGLRYTPLTTKDHRRVGTRERVLDVATRLPNQLKIQMHALVTRVLLDSEKRAIGVEYESGERLYGAHPRQNTAGGTTKQVFAAREVILAGGTFNTPQLLMLSGIGPREAIEKHGLTCVEDLPGVGKNLQDRYEVAVVNRMKFPAWKVLEGATFTRADPQYRDWAEYKSGVYDTNGTVLSVVARSGPAAFSPDLFLYSVIGRFEGYFPGYSSLIAQNPNCLTWVVLKAHTNNTGGEVTLASKDPRVPPSINFHYFDEGTDARKQDIKAVAAGVALARTLSAGLKKDGMIEKEEMPGEGVTGDALLEFIRNQAWGHHASGTCRIGRREDGGVVSTNFDVHGITGLRVVDASVFPRIPGFFLASAVFMIGEKAADVIAAAARQSPALGAVKPLIGAFVVLVTLACTISANAGQTPASGPQGAVSTSSAAPSIEASVEALARIIESQQKLLEEQGRQIEQLRREIAEARGLMLPASAPQATSSPSNPPQQGATPQSPAADDRSGKRGSEVPPDIVTVEEFPGAFKLPGSDAALRIGGLVRVNWVSTYDPLLVDDRFQTSAIPVASSAQASQSGRVNVIASPSRFNFDLRTPTGVGYMRAFIEGDFAGNNNTLRLRHAYGQWRRFIFGQTWSTFSDPEAEPDGIDFEGLNAIVLFRQPQIRWSFAPGERFRMAFALEDPRPDLTGAIGLNQVPDVVSRLRFEPRRGGHVQLSGVVRQLRGEPSGFPGEIVAASGYGLNISGRLPMKLLNDRDQFLFQHNSGRGLGRYISDLGAYGGQDGVFDVNTHTLHALDVLSGYVGFEHWWTASLRSSVSFGIVGISNLDFQPDDALHRTRRGTINFMWSPIPRLDLVTEFLWGDRQNKDGQTGFAAQTQIGSTFRF